MPLLLSTPVEYFFGLALTTHRAKELGPDAASYFLYEGLIAAIAILFFRSTVQLFNAPEPVTLKWFFAVLLAVLAYCKKSYELILAVQIFSFAVPWVLQRQLQLQTRNNTLRRSQASSKAGSGTIAKNSSVPAANANNSRDMMVRLVSIAAAACLSLLLSHLAASGGLAKLFRLTTPKILVRALSYLFPVAEMQAAYDIMAAFADPAILEKQARHLLFVTFHIQVGMGYLGIGFLRKEQHRRNQLVRLDVPDKTEVEENTNTTSNATDRNNGKDEALSASAAASVTTSNLQRSQRFQRGAAPFILLSALPYMFQIILYGNINKFAFTCFQHDLHRQVRLNQLFDNDNHLLSLALESPISPEAYANSMNSVASTAYEMFNRKLFSLPKVLLLPAIMARQPLMVAQVFPFIMLSDWVKASAVSFMTTTIEKLQKELQDVRAIRSKVEAFDMKNAELLQRSGIGATRFTQQRWEELTVKVQAKVVVSDLLSRSKGFFSFIQRNFVFSVLVDCALADLIATGRILTSEIFVFSRAIEDTVDMVLMRSRGEAELARMMTEITKLNDLKNIWDSSKSRALLRCDIAPPDKKRLLLRNLDYTRGTASVRADHVELKPGIYALTGANGSGKSTLFRVLMSCDTNEKSIDLPLSINLLTPFEPLTEEDDLRRLDSCAAIEEGAEELEECEAEQCEADLRIERELVESAPVIPKLSIMMPSSHVAEISQTFYWPLYSKPIDWIYQDYASGTLEAVDLEKRLRRVAEELQSLQFFQPVQAKDDDNEDNIDGTTEATIHRIMDELQEEKEDWFGDLSGGQKSKVELTRKVFLQEKCQDVLLIDETMAPLDPDSKSLVMAKLKEFCNESIIIVIYHTDVGRGGDTGSDEEFLACVPSNNFFDENIHLEKGFVHVKKTC